MTQKHETLAITGWGVLSSIGMNKAEFADAVLSEKSGKRTLEGTEFEEGPFT